MSDFETVPRGTLEELGEVKAERDALAAHVERLQSAVRAAETPSGVIHVCETWMIDTHQASLARLKARWRAEALDKEVGNFTRDAGDADSCTEKLIYKRVARCLRESSANLRRQAEADQ